jgi:N-acetyl-anhydromuramoyl-L-alanine amidase
MVIRHGTQLTNMSESSRIPMWHDGWYRYAGGSPSPNFGPRPVDATVDLVVIHSISLPPGEFGNSNVRKLFTNQLDWNAHPYFQSIRNLQVSAHFFICRAGGLWQFVSCDQRAWHAGKSSYLGRADCNNHSIGIELEGLEGGYFELSQYETLTAVCAAILSKYPVRHFAGHEHVAIGRKLDPGPGFDWAHLERSLGLTTGWLPAGVL